MEPLDPAEADGRFGLLQVIAAYGSDTVIARIMALHTSGCHHAARAIERELFRLDLPQPILSRDVLAPTLDCSTC
jgi:hypothetical protein